MSQRVEERQQRLRQAILDHARAALAEGPVGALHARTLATQAGCSVGTLYNLFPDLDAIVMAVTLGTLRTIDETMAETARAGADDDPADRMVALGHAYHRFAKEHRGLWRAMFDHTPGDPDMALTAVERRHSDLFRHIEAPLSALLPDADAELLGRRARALFSAVHGIVSLAVDRRIAGVSEEAVPGEIEAIVRGYVAGVRTGA